MEETLKINPGDLEQSGQCFIYSNQIHIRPTALMLKTYHRLLLTAIQERQGVLHQCNLEEVSVPGLNHAFLVIALAELPAGDVFLMEEAFALEIPMDDRI